MGMYVLIFEFITIMIMIKILKLLYSGTSTNGEPLETGEQMERVPNSDVAKPGSVSIVLLERLTECNNQ